MKWSCMTITVAVVVLVCGCGSKPDMQRVQRVTLQCKAPSEGKCFSPYSFTRGVLTTLPADPDQIDIVYYFDGNDYPQGALIGHGTGSGYFFPIGKKSWSESAMLKPRLNDKASVATISPLTKDKEGLAFWVKPKRGGYVLVRIRSVKPASYKDLVSGGTATLEFEWSRSRTREGK